MKDKTVKNIIIKTNGKTYPVIIGNSILDSLIGLVEKYALYKNLFIIIDENVLKSHRESVNRTFNGYKEKINYYELKSGENSKSFNELSNIFSELIKGKFSRDTLVIAIGGGVTGDLAGFAASIYMRGIQLAHIPTSLLAMVDSSIGGKTGINFNKYKNIIGAFYQPQFVLIDTDFLKTLPEEEINSGAGELIKYAFLTNEDFYNYLSDNFKNIFLFDKNFLNKLIYESVLFKGSVVTKDEQEGGLRKILNLGHTFAHAYESNADLKLKHGEAVIAGIISALFLSNKKGFLSDKKLNYFLGLPLKINLSNRFNIGDFDQILNYMRGDKKNRNGKVRFILLKGIGKLIIDYEAEEKNIFYAIEKTKNLLTK